MAKLNVTIPAVDVIVNGPSGPVTYRKVDRKAQAGDIVKVTDGAMPSYVITGAFYAVEKIDTSDDTVYIRDEDGDGYWLSDGEYETYKKTAQSTVEITHKGGTYRKVDRDAREYDVIVFTDEDELSSYVTLGKPYLVTEIDSFGDAQISDDDGDEFDTCGYDLDVYEKIVTTSAAQPQYREVVRMAVKGDKIRVTKTHSTDEAFAVGDVLTVTGADRDGDIWYTEPTDVRGFIYYDNIQYGREYVVLEPVEAKYSAGDYVKVTGNSVYHDYEEGSVVKITEVKDNTGYGGQQFRAETADGKRGCWLVTNDVEPADEAAFEAQKTTPARLKVGEFAKVLSTSRMYTEDYVSVDDIVKITQDDETALPFRAETLGGKRAGWFTPEQLTPATPGEVSAAQRKLAVGPFADGGFAIVTVTGNEGALLGFSDGDHVTVSQSSGAYALRLAKLDGSIGFANADALRQITEAEYTEASAPKPEFSVGDYARVTADNYEHRVGHIVKITEIFGRYGFDFGVDEITHGGTGYITAKNIEKITAEEAQEITKWAAIGRKVGEFKHGDIVKISSTDWYDGIVGEIEDIGDRYVGVREFNGAYRGPCMSDAILIVPVEQRFDTRDAVKSAA